MKDVDVVVVGGGVAGSAAAARLAASGVGVLVLEREAKYEDRIRGEGFGAFGFEQVTELGLAEVVSSVPGFNAAERIVPYDEALSIEAADRAAVQRPIYCVGHPDLREQLIARAATVGAVVARGVETIRVTAGDTPTVT